MADVERPLSPHLGIWRWSLAMALSIAHRATGIANALTALLIVWGLVAAASGPEYFDFFIGCVTSALGRLVLFGLTFALMLHLCTGVRHLVMDTGRALEPATNRRLGMAMVLLAVVLTLAVWIAAYHVAGLI